MRIPQLFVTIPIFLLVSASEALFQIVTLIAVAIQMLGLYLPSFTMSIRLRPAVRALCSHQDTGGSMDRPKKFPQETALRCLSPGRAT